MSHGPDSDSRDVALDSTQLPAAESVPAAAPGELSAGLVLSGTYKLEKRLGRGGMGEVWKAEHLRLPKPVAIKVLLPSISGSAEVLQRFKREAEIGSKLAHPNIVHVFDFNELDDGRKYIAMDFLTGEALQSRLERGRVPHAEVRAILEQTVAGLRVAHDAGVVHRDLKPDNLFLAEEPSSQPPYRVKILDFGISKIQTTNAALTRDMAVMGTPGYMAPEQAMGQTSTLGPKADQFSLATIVYEMLTGKVAFHGDTLAEIVFKVVQETPPPIQEVAPDVPAHCARAVARAMSKSPDDRFPDVAAFLEAFIGGDSREASSAPTLPATDVVAPSAPVGAEPKATSARLPWVLLSVAVLALGAVGFYAWSDQAAGEGDPEEGDPPLARPPETSPEATEVTDEPRVVAEPEHVEIASSEPSELAPSEPSEMAPGEPAEMVGRMREGSVSLSPEAQSLLEQAEAALAEQRTGQAIQLAQRSLRAQRSDAAFEVLAKAYCQQRDLGLVNANARRLPRAMKRRVTAYCRNFGLTPAP